MGQLGPASLTATASRAGRVTLQFRDVDDHPESLLKLGRGLPQLRLVYHSAPFGGFHHAENMPVQGNLGTIYLSCAANGFVRGCSGLEFEGAGR